MLAITEVNCFNLPAASRGRNVSGTTAHTPTRPRASGSNTSDGALIKAIALGDRRAMELLYARHGVRVYRFSLRITGDAAVAEDIASEVFLEVWRRADRFKADSQVSTWLLAIARNKSHSALHRRVHVPLEDERATVVEDPADGPEISVYNKDRNALVQACLSQLSTAHQDVIDLIYFQEKSVEDVARIVGAPASTVKTRVFYARHRMAELLNSAGLNGS